MSSGDDPAALVPDEALAEAVDFAVQLARARRRSDAGSPPPPPRLVQLSSRRPLRGALLAEARRLLDGADEFRSYVATRATPELVGEVAMAWLERGDGWADIVRSAVVVPPAPLAESQVERKLKGAEQARDRLQGELEELRRKAGSLSRRVEELEHERDELGRRLTQADAARDSEHRRAQDARERLRQARQERKDALDQVAGMRERLREAEAVRDRVLEERSLAWELPVAAPAAAPPARRERPPQRQPLAIPGGLLDTSRAVAAHLLDTAGVLLIVDGYNVAMSGWPACDTALQRECLLDAMETVVRRHGTDVLVVFDAARFGEVVGATTRRFVHVEFTPRDVIADDVIVERVSQLPVDRPVVVATDDQELRGRVQRKGANLLRAEQLLDLALR